jgi:hypothetical protein
MQTHCQKNKKIKRADQILPEVYGTTLNAKWLKEFERKQTTSIGLSKSDKVTNDCGMGALSFNNNYMVLVLHCMYTNNDHSRFIGHMTLKNNQS